MLKPVKNKKDYENALERIYLLIQKAGKRTENESVEFVRGWCPHQSACN